MKPGAPLRAGASAPYVSRMAKKHPIFPLPAITYPLSIDTVGKHIVLGYEITAHCNRRNCAPARRINLVTIARARGMDFDLSQDSLRSVFYCAPCVEAGYEGKDLTFTMTPPTDPHSIIPGR